jgi:hypothetical protein
MLTRNSSAMRGRHLDRALIALMLSHTSVTDALAVSCSLVVNTNRLFVSTKSIFLDIPSSSARINLT